MWATSQLPQTSGLSTKQRHHLWASLPTGSRARALAAGHCVVRLSPSKALLEHTTERIWAAISLGCASGLELLVVWMLRSVFLVFLEALVLTLHQLYCITTDNTSNNDTTCAYIEQTLTSQQIYSFNADQHRLPCLTHVINLAITDFMSIVTKTAHIETTTAIWEFDPTLPQNWVLGNSLDVIVVIRTLAIKIQASGQCITYFEHLQKECKVDVTLKIPLYSNTHWGTAEGMLAQSYDLQTVHFVLALLYNH